MSFLLPLISRVAKYSPANGIDICPVLTKVSETAAADQQPDHQHDEYDRYNTSGGTVVTITIVTTRSEEHTSELQSLRHLVFRLLLVKKERKDMRQIMMTTNARPGCLTLEEGRLYKNAFGLDLLVIGIFLKKGNPRSYHIFPINTLFH